MMKRAFYPSAALLITGFLFRTSPAAAFSSIQTASVAAVAVIAAGAPPVRIVASPLPQQAFFGKNVVIPVTVISDSAPVNTQNLEVDIVYNLVDVSSNVIGAQTSTAIPLQRDSHDPDHILNGVALIPREQLLNIQHGGQLQYYFRARQFGTDTLLTQSGISHVSAGSGQGIGQVDSFQVSIIDTLCMPVNPSGTVVSVPDLFQKDGQTSANFAPGSVTMPGTLCIKQEDPLLVPTGPGGVPPVVVYSFQLEGTSLVQTANIALSYSVDPGGKVTGTSYKGTDLGMANLDSFAWRIVGSPHVDTTLHTVTATTAHFSQFALFPTGAIGTANLRPPQRIITPNGDGVNDTAVFATGIDEVHIFDIRGRRVRTIAGPAPVWDGTDDDGNIVESGVYIYQYSAQGDRISGVIVVAK